MREILKQAIAHRRIPLIMAHAGGAAHGRPNSVEAVQSSTRYNPDIFEIDVRKSRDGILFCHHGSLPFGLVFSQALFLLNFGFILKLLGPLNTLNEILNAIPASAITYLDIKSRHITGEDLLEIIGGHMARQIWIAAYGLNHLKKLRDKLGDNFVYVFNRPVVFWGNFLKKSAGLADIIQLFVWQWTDNIAQKARAANMEIHLADWFVPRPKRRAIGKRYDDVWLSYDDLRLTR